MDIYEMPYDPERPVVCMDEKPYQLLGEATEPLPMRPGNDQKVDSEYTRNGTCSIFAFVEPLGGKHHVSVRGHRTATDWAEEIKYLVDVMYPEAEKRFCDIIKIIGPSDAPIARLKDMWRKHLYIRSTRRWKHGAS